MRFATLLYKVTISLSLELRYRVTGIVTRFKFWCLNVEHKGIAVTGVPFLSINRSGRLTIGHNFKMHNGIAGNPIGCHEKCVIVIGRDSHIKIGDNVGISQTALIAHAPIVIGDNVKIGGGCCLWTTDFHSLDPTIRISDADTQHRAVAPITIGDNAFIGAKSIILKGVTIGQNSIVGAGSVVTKSIPANEIWGGNPAQKIREIK